MLKMSQSFVIRMTLWSVLVLYMVCDFFVFKGPLQQELQAMFRSPADRAQRAMSQGVCAKVWNGPIYRSQVDYRVQEKLWRTGRDPEKVSEQELKLLRWAALDDLIDEAILRIKARVNREEAPVSEAEIDAELAQFEKRFATADELDQALGAQGIESREELRFRIAARIQQDHYVQLKIKDAITVSEQDARSWYDDHKKQLTMPERREVRHVFLPTLDHPSDEAKATLQEHLIKLQKEEIKFAELAASLSEDASSKDRGGNLGWLRKKRLPGDFATAVFSMTPKQPTLLRTKLGWHLVEVTGVKAAELLPFESVKEEIITDLMNSRREAAVKQYRHQLRLLNQDQIEIYRSMLD
ncbi:peptidylprolyl isomerase [Verrucomicrobiaceae bacterium 5K15]|uniref:Peptidylprolyl isomerase n=1 Tax=Oceaniferula flava TaxID=2800421 RepID=A0AAE2VCY4_9BACT|nr:peptidylprolyl isomerase [Oceaniferula flavus]MBK1855521.1 peptidylprolyl isomerase [Oceaniferula flavus]MBM1136827.1 peptidylprolyl isomerase [Oceaniferula flavus]